MLVRVARKWANSSRETLRVRPRFVSLSVPESCARIVTVLDTGTDCYTPARIASASQGRDLRTSYFVAGPVVERQRSKTFSCACMPDLRKIALRQPTLNLILLYPTFAPSPTQNLDPRHVRGPQVRQRRKDVRGTRTCARIGSSKPSLLSLVIAPPTLSPPANGSTKVQQYTLATSGGLGVCV